jgi:subtilisin family serine protease
MENRRNFLLIGVVYIVLIMLFSVVQIHAQTSERKIVVWKSGVSEAVKTKISREHGMRIKNLSLINGEVVMTGGRDLEALKKDPNILRVDDDLTVQAFGSADKEMAIKGKIAPIFLAEQLPWGIDKVDAELAWSAASTAPRIKVGIIDTGIDLTHMDLKANIKGGVNTISSRKSYTDDNGHGTHVAGIIGAIKNTIGVVGVDPRADLYAIKALDRNGSGYFSDIIEGLDWAIAHKIQVVNMSLGAPAGNASLASAILRAHNAGIIIVAAAGNDGVEAVSYPAAYPEVIAVSATDKNDTIAYFSSFGPEVDVSAPGVGIYSTYKGGTYATMSGTSMATPHAAGEAALVLSFPITAPYDANGDGKWQPEEVQAKIQNTSKDTGDSGWDKYFGWGRINAFLAIQ